MSLSDWLTYGAAACAVLAVVPAGVEAIRRRRRRNDSLLFAAREIRYEDAQRQLEAAVPAQEDQGAMGQAYKQVPSRALQLITAWDDRLPLSIVLPRYGSGDPLHSPVTREDLRAVQSIAAVTPYIRESSNNLLLPDEVSLETRGNLLLVGSDRRNEVVSRVFRYHRERTPNFDIAFVPIVAPDIQNQWALRFNGSTYASPLHRQEVLYRNDPNGFSGGFSDYGLVARLPNPWDPDGVVILLCGIRALGTEGAGRFLADQSDAIFASTHGRDFAAVVLVQREEVRKDWLITERTEIVTFES